MELREECMEDVEFDIIVAGAGLAGTLAANRLFQTLKGVKILVLEKDRNPGGRILSYSTSDESWGYGLNFLSARLLEFISHTFSIEPDLDTHAQLYEKKLQYGSILAAGKFNDFLIENCFSAEGVKALGGTAAVKEWKKIEGLLENSDEIDKISFAKAWKEGKKNPAATVLQHFSSFCGFADLWKISPKAIYERSKDFQSGLYSGPWNQVIEQLLSFPSMKETLRFEPSCRIIDATMNEDRWVVQTEKGCFKSKALLVAQSPWETLDWLDRSHIPLSVLQMALKTKPTSLVTLSTKPKNIESVRDLVYIPSEEVMVLKSSDNVINFQTVIDYESTLNAPSVVKAVKRLKRARKKLEKFKPELLSEKEHIALVPVAWTQSAYLSERKYVHGLANISNYQLEHLSFCGDSYGEHYCPDVNLLKSLTSACTSISKTFQNL